MVSLGGIPPLAGFWKVPAVPGAHRTRRDDNGCYWLAGVAVMGGDFAVLLFCRDLDDVLAKDPPDLSRLLSGQVEIPLAVCMAAMLYLGTFPGVVLPAPRAVKVLNSKKACSCYAAPIIVFQKKFMADIANNIRQRPGKYYVDNQCIDCDLCRERPRQFHPQRR